MRDSTEAETRIVNMPTRETIIVNSLNVWPMWAMHVNIHKNKLPVVAGNDSLHNNRPENSRTSSNKSNSNSNDSPEWVSATLIWLPIGVWSQLDRPRFCSDPRPLSFLLIDQQSKTLWLVFLQCVQNSLDWPCSRLRLM